MEQELMEQELTEQELTEQELTEQECLWKDKIKEFRAEKSWSAEAVRFGLCLVPHLKDVRPGRGKTVIQHC
jgi:uncharacterized protein YnzC (UPF0291/DUF896 family)